MRVVFLEDVAGVAQGGDVKEVKNGFARNYLIPKQLAAPATRDALQRTARLTRHAEDKRIETLSDMKALGERLNGIQANIEMRAGVSGRLYGSVTNAIVAAELSEMTGHEIDRRTIEIPDSIREVGIYDVPIRPHPEVDASIKLLVYPVGTDPAEFQASLEASKEKEATGAEATVAEATEAVTEGQPGDAVAIAEEAQGDSEEHETDENPEAPREGG